jgi:NADH-quinone oxidoreductase subunit L
MFSKLLWGVGALTALLTAVYMTRMMVMTFWGSERFRETPADEAHAHSHGVHEPHESPWIMTIPLIALAILSTIGGFIGVPYALSSLVTDRPMNYIEHTLEPVVARIPGGHPEEAGTGPELISKAPQEVDSGSPLHGLSESTGVAASVSAEEIRDERLLALVSVLIAASGIAAGWVIFQKRPLLQMPRILEKKYYVDEIYDATIIHPIEVVSREGLWKLFDQGVIDGLLHSLGEAVTEFGRLARYMQGGFVRGYAAIILLGALVVIGFFAYYSVQAMGLVP